ncbi:unnamed protein product [Cylindrotheca closterium]|uniref:J domain-containing protein n=1 Tax=Cylindrotheca closterium TaxID=2856 RepID=A0AAD2FEF4_9STRA|nr:unnamed protein product [Cylindrotheca closterium]
MPERRPHSILGVSKDASEAEIKAAYHKAAKKYHPDKQTSTQDKEKANQLFSQVNEAYESLMSQFHSSYGDEGREGEQDLAGEPPSRNRPKEGCKKVRKRSSTGRSNLSNSQRSSESAGENQKPSSFSRQPGPESSPRGHRRASSASNSPASNHSKRSIRMSRSNMVSPVPKSPSAKKSVRDSIRSKSPHATSSGTPRQRPRPVQRNSSTPSRHSSGPALGASAGAASAPHRRSRSSLVGGAPPPKPPLDSPVVTRKKHSPMNSPASPHGHRRVGSMRVNHNRPSSFRTNGDASLSPLRTKKSPVHARHGSFGSLNFHANIAPPPPSMPALSPTATKSLKKAKAPPPPQSTLQRLSVKLTSRNELKAEKKARAEKLMQ